LDYTNFVIDILYTYYKYFEKVYIFKPITSNPVGGEFYIIGKRFKTIEKFWMDDYFDKLKNFKVDIKINEDIPKKFMNMIYYVFSKLIKYKTKNIIKQNIIIQTDMIKNDKTNKIFNEFINKYKRNTIELWLKTTKFK